MEHKDTAFIAARSIVELEPVYQALITNCKLPENLTLLQLRTLFLLRRFGKLTISEIANHHQVTKQHMSQTVPIMEKKNLVVRSKDICNKKNVYVSITDKGLAVLEQYTVIASEYLAELMNAISPEEMEEIIMCCGKLKSSVTHLLEQSNPLYLREKKI